MAVAESDNRASGIISLMDYTEACDDPRPVPPLGYCAQCIRGGTWMRAVAMWEGTTLCGQCLLYMAGVTGDDDSLHEAAKAEGKSPELLVNDHLRRGLRRSVRTAGY